MLEAEGEHQKRISSLKDPLLESAPRVFAWEESNDALEAIEAGILQLRGAAAHGAFCRIEQLNAAAGQWFQEAFESLPPWALKRFLHAPETGCRISAGDHEIARHASFFHGALSAEQGLSGIKAPNKECWSALGDFHFAVKESSSAPAEPCEAGPNFAAPRIGNLIPVDFVSPNAQFVNSLSNCPYDPYTPSETNKLGDKLDEAFANISLVKPATAQLISRFIKVIIPRKNPLRPNWSGSSSAPSHIGRLLFRNGHLMDTGALADALVHEAIHAILYSIECSNPLVSAAPAGLLIRSPWSGNSLSIRTYLHACFVWYGLAKFWHAALPAEVFPADRVKQLLAKALSGFRRTNPIDAVLPYAHLVSRTSLETAGSLQANLQGEGEAGWEPQG